MNPSGLMIRTARIRLLLGISLLLMGCGFLYLMRLGFRLKGAEHEGHLCLQQKDSVVAQLQVCMEYRKRVENSLDKEKVLWKECQDTMLAQRNELKANKERDEEKFKKILQELEDLKREKKAVDEELVTHQDQLAQSKEKAKVLQGQVEDYQKKVEELTENLKAESLRADQIKVEVESCRTIVKDLQRNLTSTAKTTPSPENSSTPEPTRTSPPETDHVDKAEEQAPIEKNKEEEGADKKKEETDQKPAPAPEELQRTGTTEAPDQTTLQSTLPAAANISKPQADEEAQHLSQEAVGGSNKAQPGESPVREDKGLAGEGKVPAGEDKVIAGEEDEPPRQEDMEGAPGTLTRIEETFHGYPEQDEENKLEGDDISVRHQNL